MQFHEIKLSSKSLKVFQKNVQNHRRMDKDYKNSSGTPVKILHQCDTYSVVSLLHKVSSIFYTYFELVDLLLNSFSSMKSGMRHLHLHIKAEYFRMLYLYIHMIL